MFDHTPTLQLCAQIVNAPYNSDQSQVLLDQLFVHLIENYPADAQYAAECAKLLGSTSQLHELPDQILNLHPCVAQFVIMKCLVKNNHVHGNQVIRSKAFHKWVSKVRHLILHNQPVI